MHTVKLPNGYQLSYDLSDGLLYLIDAQKNVVQECSINWQQVITDFGFCSNVVNHGFRCLKWQFNQTGESDLSISYEQAQNSMENE